MVKSQQQKPTDRLVLSLGGSLIVPGDGVDRVFLRRFRNWIKREVQQGRRFVVICGGGQTARDYQRAAAAGGRQPDAAELDQVGIEATRLNALLVQTVLGPELTAKSVVTDPNGSVPRQASVIVGAGFRPGHSTDYQAVAWAKRVGAKTVINLSNIRYVYDRDPKRFSKVTPLKNLTWPEFRQYCDAKRRPGMHSPFDPAAAVLAERAKLRVVVLDGRNFANLNRLCNGKWFEGTVIE